MSTTKKDIVKQIADRLSLPQIDTKNAVQSMLDGIIEILVAEGRLELRDFGVFQVKVRKARKARNPRSGQEVIVPERKVVTFKAGRLLQARLKDAPTAAAAPAPGDTP